jgi:hypothetical protein
MASCWATCYYTFGCFWAGCEVWSLTLREEHRPRVLRRIFGPKRDEVTGGWRKLPNKELHSLYSMPSIIRMIKSRRMKCAGHVVQMGAKKNTDRVLMVKPDGMRPLGRPKCTRVCNMKIDLRDIGWDGIDWIDLAEDRSQCRALVNMLIILWVP